MAIGRRKISETKPERPITPQKEDPPPHLAEVHSEFLKPQIEKEKENNLPCV